MLPTKRASAPAADPVRNPFDELQRLAHDMLSWTDALSASRMDGFLIALGDLEETDDTFVVEIDLPGVDKKDVDVQLEARRLVVTAERKERERTGVLRHRTRTVGTYRHEIMLPTDVRDDGVEASLADGVLTVRLPKTEAGQRRRISVS